MRENAEDMWRTAFKESMGDEVEKHEFIYEENIEGTYKWSTKEVDNVKEAYGNPEEIKNIINGCEIVVSGYAPFTSDVIEASDSLRLIGISRGGPVNVDRQAALEKEVYVLRAVGRNAESVADQTMGLILGELRYIARHNHEIKSGEYFEKLNAVGRSDYLGSFNWMEANGKTLGLIGYGQVGRRVAKRAQAFDMIVKVFDPYIDEELLRHDNCEPIDLETLLQESDFISIHAALSPNTRHMINSDAFSKMNKTAVLINTARGSIIDEKALYDALKNETIASAAIDVVEEDPIKPDNSLISLKNITLTPHTGGRSPDTEMRGYRQIAQQVARYLRGEEIQPIHVYNKEIING